MGKLVYDDISKDKDISIIIEGEAFKKGFELYSTLEILDNFQSILDKAYLITTNKNRITDKDREMFKIQAKYEPGSFIAHLNIYIAAMAQLALPVLNVYSPSSLWEIVKGSFEFLKVILEAKKDGKTVEIQRNNSGDGDDIVYVINGNPTIVNALDYKLSLKILDNLKNIANRIDDTQVKSFEVMDSESKGNVLRIDKNNKNDFDIKSKVDVETIGFFGRIFKIDVDAKKGKLEVLESDDNDVKNKEFNFTVVKPNIIKDCCNFIDSPAVIIALKEFVVDRLETKEKVNSLILISIKQIEG